MFFLMLFVLTTDVHAQTTQVDYTAGVAMYKQKDYKKSVVHFNMYLTANPTDYAGYYNRALAYKHLKKTVEAVNDLSRAIALHPAKEIYILRATLYNTLNRYDEALADLNNALQMDSANYKALYQRGIAYVALGKTAEAIADFDNAISKTPDANVYTINYTRYIETIDNDIAQ